MCMYFSLLVASLCALVAVVYQCIYWRLQTIIFLSCFSVFLVFVCKHDFISLRRAIIVQLLNNWYIIDLVIFIHLNWMRSFYFLLLQHRRIFYVIGLIFFLSRIISLDFLHLLLFALRLSWITFAVVCISRFVLCSL